MTRITIPSHKIATLWSIGVSFVLFQFLLQMSSGIVISQILLEKHWSAFIGGMLGSAFYYVYTLMQIPVGILFDNKNTRILISFNALLCALGCIIFASGHSFLLLMSGRLCIGAGSAFAFIGLSHLLRQYFPLKQFSFWIGLSETIVLLGVVLSTFLLGELVTLIGWRYFIYSAALLGIAISVFAFHFIPNQHHHKDRKFQWQHVLIIMKNPLGWLNGLYVGASFTVISVFGGMWATPFLMEKLSCSLSTATRINALIFLGTAVSCPLFGKITLWYPRRRPILMSSSVITTLLMLLTLYAPIHSTITMGWLFFLTGLSCGAYMITYAIANELAPTYLQSTSTGFTNTLAMITAPILQPVVGFLADYFQKNPSLSSKSYGLALSVIPIALIISCFFIRWLPEKK